LLFLPVKALVVVVAVVDAGDGSREVRSQSAAETPRSFTFASPAGTAAVISETV